MSSQEVADQWMEETSDIVDMQLEIEVSSQMSTMMASGAGASVTLESTDLDDIKRSSFHDAGGGMDRSRSAERLQQCRRDLYADPGGGGSAGGHGTRMAPAQVAGAMYSMISGPRP